jgi:hypothetical protein
MRTEPWELTKGRGSSSRSVVRLIEKKRTLRNGLTISRWAVERPHPSRPSVVSREWFDSKGAAERAFALQRTGL